MASSDNVVGVIGERRKSLETARERQWRHRRKSESVASSASRFRSMWNKVFGLRRRWCKGAVGCSYFLRLRYPSRNWYLPLLSTGLGTVGW